MPSPVFTEAKRNEIKRILRDCCATIQSRITLADLDPVIESMIEADKRLRDAADWEPIDKRPELLARANKISRWCMIAEALRTCIIMADKIKE